MTAYLIPCLLAFVVIFALRRKTDVYAALVQGAENGLNITFHIVPALVALMTGVASVVDLARLGSAVVTIGNNMELNAIVAVVIGGNKLSGGEGSFGKTVAGLLFICILYNGLSTMGITDDLMYVLKGGMILAALAIQMLSNRYRTMRLQQLNRMG